MSAPAGVSFTDESNGYGLGYSGLWVSDIAEPFGDDTSDVNVLRHKVFAAANKDAVLPTTVNVMPGVPFILGALIDADGVSVPASVTWTVTRPDGTRLNTDTPLWSDDLVVHHDAAGNLAAIMVRDPEAGTWTFSVDSQASSDQYQLFVSTLPKPSDTVVPFTDIAATLEGAFGSGSAPSEIVGVEGWGKCTWCKVGVWSAAVIITAAVAIGVSFLTTTSAPVVALAAFASVSAQVALAFIGTLTALVTLGVGAVVVEICKWTNACS